MLEPDCTPMAGTGTPLDAPLDPDVLRRIPWHMAARLKLLPVGFQEPQTLVVAMVNPFDFGAMDAVRLFTGLKIEPRACSMPELQAALAFHYRDLG